MAKTMNEETIYVITWIVLLSVTSVFAYIAGYRCALAICITLLVTVWVVYSLRSNMVEHFGDAPKMNWMYDLVDNVYCITLKRRTNRVINAEAFFDSIRVKPTYVDAIDKKYLDVAGLTSECDENGVCKLIQGFSLSYGEVACYLSHLKTLTMFLEDKHPDGKPFQTCIICEDDVQPIESEHLPIMMKKVSDVINQVTAVKWHVVNMGPCLSWCNARKKLPNATGLYNGVRSSSKCTHFMLVNRKGAQAILDKAFPIYRTSYDVKLNILARQNEIILLETDVPIVTQNRDDVKSELKHNDKLVHCTTVTRPDRDFLLFTSAGDQTNWFDMWADKERTYDIMVTFYGDNATKSELSRTNADRFFSMKGSKFQNLYNVYHSKPEYFNGYKYIAVFDDDIEMSTLDINRLFETANRHKLWVCQPSFTSDSKISHDITEHNDGLEMVFSNFIEMNAPVFKASKLLEFLNHRRNDGTLYGFGTDHLYMHLLGEQNKLHYAIIHNIQARNPHDEEKPDGREILKLASQEERTQQWKQYSTFHDIATGVKPRAIKCVGDWTEGDAPSFCNGLKNNQTTPK